jgi:2,4-dienoyl-CoA reductase-like NADH-dependent reductase (Old Yellow Enzyme family)/thioredoxin reductase
MFFQGKSRVLSTLFQPFRLGSLELRNRLVMPPMVTFLANESGAVTQRMIDYYAERARGGVGLITVESAYILEKDRDLGRLGIENPQLQVGLAGLAESIQEQGARAFLQLNHRGSVLSIHRGKGPDELSREEIDSLIEAFAEAALRARKAGFDGVEVHGANIYLISQFLSPLTNHRMDRYGGDLESRLNFPLDILRRVREKVGEDFPVNFRMVGHQYTEGGLVLEDGKTIARRLEEAGATALHVVAGSPAVPYWHTPPMAIPRGCHAELAGEIKKAVRIPVIAVGRINDPLLAEWILEEGKADLIAMGRALIADPDLPLKAREGRFEEIRKCLACNHCRKRVIQMNRTLRCAVNAQAGRERDSRIHRTGRSRKVLVIGGGPAGMEAARVMALRGHRVVLYEKKPRLGGQVNLAVIPPHKEELRTLLDFLVVQLEKLKVQTHCGAEATADTVAKEKPEAIILASGARLLVPEIPGIPEGKIFTPEEALEHNRPMGEKIVVIGGGMVGCEVAECLAARGKRVTIVEKLPEIAVGMEGHTRRLLLERLNRLSVRIITGAEVLSLQGGKAILLQAGKKVDVEAEAIVAAMGAAAERSGEEFQSCGVPVYAVGDCAGVRDIAAAIQEGFAAAMRI